MLVTETAIESATFGISLDMLPLELNKTEVNLLLDDVTNYQLEDSIGENASINKALQVIKLLDINRVYLFPHNSRGDSFLKLDLLVKTKSRYLGIQLKSNLNHFNLYVKEYHNKVISPYAREGNEVRKKGLKSKYLAPGCIWCNNKSNSSEMLVQLSKWLNVPVSLKTSDSYKKFKMLKAASVKELDDFTTKTFRITADDIYIWSILGKARINGRELQYL